MTDSPSGLRIGLVACGKNKLHYGPVAARNLYTGALFRLSAAHAERTCDEWYILSARYGLLTPDRLDVYPYDETLARMSRLVRVAWAGHVGHALLVRYGTAETGPRLAGVTFVTLAGALYRRDLAPMLEHFGATIEIPMARLRIGEQLAWLKRNTRKETL